MILVAGGTGILGTRVVRQLSQDGVPVRVLTRRPERADHLKHDLVEVAAGDVRNAADVAAAMDGIEVVVSAIQGVAGVEPVGARAVDGEGNANLVRAAVAAKARRFVLVSADRAAADSPLELLRVKFAAEHAVMSSGMEWVVVRPTASMETWIGVLGDMASAKGSVTLFGRGHNPINFVGADDVAALVTMAVSDVGLVGGVWAIGGPEDLTLTDASRRLLAHRQGEVRIRHVPLPVLRVLSVVLRPITPSMAALARFAVVMDTTDMTLSQDTAHPVGLPMPPTTWDAVVTRRAEHPGG